ncbi:MAG TPA: polyprenyl diphosphate synthase [Polyangiaceae bacterium]|nr:polyprenyl diphosphate synthase [Polyangiaceae bacterium]
MSPRPQLPSELSPSASRQTPRHVAIIMDGNGRWAQANGLSRLEGHAEGARAVREAVRTCRKEGVEFLTLYAFSVANWGRPRTEVKALMNLLLDFAEREKQELCDQDVRLQVIGDLDELPLSTRGAVHSAIDFTSHCTGMTLSLALSYGGRADIVSAARALALQVKSGQLLAEEVTEEAFQQALSTHTLPPVDLLIRTGGERRVSDFLLFESAYAELYFLPIMWPDFNAKALRDAFGFFAGRERRFGLTGEQVKEAAPVLPLKTGHGFDPHDSSTSRLASDATAE